jgi:hypothetical protein
MFWQGIRKVPDKVNARIVNSKVPFAIRISNRVHRRALFATICISVVILGTLIWNSGASKTVAHADSMRGIGVGIYWDQACTNRTLSLNWGQACSNNTLTVYIKNEHNSAVSLWLGTSNWTPSASSGYMSLNWNYSGQVLNEEQVIPLELTLTVYPTISGITDFSFDIVITTTS